MTRVARSFWTTVPEGVKGAPWDLVVRAEDHAAVVAERDRRIAVLEAATPAGSGAHPMTWPAGFPTELGSGHGLVVSQSAYIEAVAKRDSRIARLESVLEGMIRAQRGVVDRETARAIFNSATFGEPAPPPAVSWWRRLFGSWGAS